MANDDTFYMTNCSPQHDVFNGAQHWLKLENAILDTADENDILMTVFTGPVLDPRDPEVKGVQIPLAFWKVIAYVRDGKLRARGYVKWQTTFVDQVRRDFESLDRLDEVEADQRSIREIARMTSLDFGALFEADEHTGRPRRLNESTISEVLRDLSRARSIRPTVSRSQGTGTRARPRSATA
jgi:endonuclease G